MSKARYMILTDPDDFREGEVRLGAKYNPKYGCHEGGQLIFSWRSKCMPANLRCPDYVARIVRLANKAIDGGWDDKILQGTE